MMVSGFRLASKLPGPSSAPRQRRLASAKPVLPPMVPLTVAGIMSGTSADGIDVALVRITPKARAAAAAMVADLRIDLLHHSATRFSPALRTAVLRAAGTGQTSTAELAQLHWRLGIAYAEAAFAAVQASGTRIDLVGCHGQTIYHQGTPARALGRAFACTWQIGEAAPLARALGVPVVSNFRPADMASGGQGAPLVPLLDYALYRHTRRARILQNIGGIGNLTVVPADATLNQVRAFDTGPGNMILDALMQQLYGRAYDRGGRTAARGTVIASALQSALAHPFFRKPPPKSAGREQFGAKYTAELLAACRRSSNRPEDAIATATALTAQSIRLACERYVLPAVTNQPVDFLVAGGGAKNETLMASLRAHLEPLGCTVATTAAGSLPVEAKEAAAFALLAYQTWHHRPGNVPAATGASSPAILGQVSYG